MQTAKMIKSKEIWANKTRGSELMQGFFSKLIKSDKGWTFMTVYINSLFEIHLFCWNWKLFADSTVDKGKN